MKWEKKKNLLEISYVVTCELQTTGIAILTIGSCANTQVVCPESQLGFQVQSAEAQYGLSFKTKLKTQVSFYHIEKTKEGKKQRNKENPPLMSFTGEWMIRGPNRHRTFLVFSLLVAAETSWPTDFPEVFRSCFPGWGLNLCNLAPEILICSSQDLLVWPANYFLLPDNFLFFLLFLYFKGHLLMTEICYD